MISGLKDRMFNISSSARRVFLLSGIAVIGVATVASMIYSGFKTITIADGVNPPKEITTFKRYVEDVLDANEIALFDGDKMNISADTKLKDRMKIEIYRAFPVSVSEKGVTKYYRTTKHTVGEALNELGLATKDTDITTPGYYDKISINSHITLTRTTSKIVEVNEEIPFECRETTNNALATGRRKLVQNGKTGEKTVSYEIIYADGVETSRKKLSETVVNNPIAQISEVGPKKSLESYQIASAGSIQTSRSGNLSYSRVITANATAYDASSCGKSPSSPGYGITATGRAAVKGVVAVDPSVIPLGTRLYIESADGSYVYGSAIAADTGGAIKGNKIDLCFNTRSEALGFGRRQVKVYILN